MNVSVCCCLSRYVPCSRVVCLYCVVVSVCVSSQSRSMALCIACALGLALECVLGCSVSFMRVAFAASFCVCAFALVFLIVVCIAFARS